jgi:hypothetical protein
MEGTVVEGQQWTFDLCQFIHRFMLYIIQGMGSSLEYSKLYVTVRDA